MITLPAIMLRLIVALLLGAAIGIERESSDHNAGLRTNALVSLGTALFTIISAFGFTELLGTQHIQLDPSRIASYVVAGIGFLGGGAIFVQPEDKRVRGLTTAASIWCVAALGMACGAGLLLEALAATALILLTLIGFRYVERLFWPLNSTNAHHLFVETEDDTHNGELIEALYNLCQKLKIHIREIHIEKPAKNAQQQRNIIKLVCQHGDKKTLFQFLSEARHLEGVTSVQLET